MLEILSRNELCEIDLASMVILEKIGIKIHDERALKLFDEAGAKVDYDEKKVKIPEYPLREAIRKAPSQFTTYGRDRKQQVKHGDDEIYFFSGVNSPYILDLENGKVREATLKDTEDSARVADYLENIAVVYPLSTPQDVPLETRLLYSFEATLRNTLKSVEAEIGTGEIVKYCFKLASAVVGGEEELKKRPLCFFTVELSSPLEFHEPQINILYESSIRGLPFKAVSLPMTGVTGPITLAGALAQSNAEVLAAVTLSQLINPGTSVIFEAIPWGFDMRKCCLPVAGGPEVALMAVASIQLGHHYGLPTRVICALTDAVVPGIQAGYEKMLGAITAALAGAHGIGELGCLKNLTSLEQLVIDNEIAGLVKRFVKRFEVNGETLALDVIHSVVESDGNFLTEKHTLDYYSREHLIPTLGNRLSRKQWEKAGAKEVGYKAKEVAKDILKTHYPEPLDKDIEKELKKSWIKQEKT